MPSKPLLDPPSTPSPTAPFAQKAHSRQILTPPFSFTSALLSRSARDLPHSFLPRANSARGAQTARSVSLFRSLSKERKTSLLFSTACVLFAKKTGVYPSYGFRVSTIQLLTALDSILTETPSCKPFRMNTYKKQGGGGGVAMANHVSHEGPLLHRMKGICLPRVPARQPGFARVFLRPSTVNSQR